MWYRRWGGAITKVFHYYYYYYYYYYYLKPAAQTQIIFLIKRFNYHIIVNRIVLELKKSTVISIRTCSAKYLELMSHLLKVQAANAY